MQTRNRSGFLAVLALCILLALQACGGSSGDAAGPATATSPPTLYSDQPTSQTVTANQPARFEVYPSGGQPVTFQWQRNGSDIAGATARVYNFIAQPNDTGSEFRVRVANAAGSVTSSQTRLTVLPGRAGSMSLLAGSLAGPGNFDGVGAAARFNFPGGVALDAAGNLYVADTFNSAIRKMTPAGVVTTLVDPVTQATSVAVDASGNLLVVTGGRFPELLRIDSNGAFVTVSGAPIYYASAVAIDGGGNYVVASGGAIYRVTPEGASTLLAGSDSNGPGGGGAPLFNQVSALAVAASGTVYVADGGNNSIQAISTDGAVATLVPASAGLKFPAGLALDAAGNLFVADAGNQVIRKITPVGAISVFAGAIGVGGSADGRAADARFNSPRGLALDANGNLFVADSGNATIRKIDAAGRVTTLAGMAPAAGPTFGEYQASDGAGNVYVASVTSGGSGASPDSGILKIAPDGSTATLATAFKTVRGMAVDAAGNLFVVEVPGSDGTGVVRKITPQGSVSTVAPASGQAPDGLAGAGPIAVDPAGNLYVGTFFGQIQKITPTGVVTTFAMNRGAEGLAFDGAGNLIATACTPVTPNITLSTITRIAPDGTSTVLVGGISGFADGPLGDARFVCPQGVAIDAAGNIYVADTNLVRQIGADGLVTTVVGRYDASGIAPGPLPASLYQPTGLSVDGAGNLYVGSAAAILKVRFSD